VTVARNDDVKAPKNIGKPKSLEEEQERIQATYEAETLKIRMPDGSYEQVDNVKPAEKADVTLEGTSNG
jgi:hypothetical protein